MKSDVSLLLFSLASAQLPREVYFTAPQPRLATRLTITALVLSFCVTASSIACKRCRNLNLLSIAYDLSPRLRSRLTLGGSTFPRNPWAFDAHVSRMGLATHTGILSSVKSTPAPAEASPFTQCSSTDAFSCIPLLRWRVLAPLHLRRCITRPVSYYALF